MGVSVVIANDGMEACECCDQALPDFVLMDINMPNRDVRVFNETNQ